MPDWDEVIRYARGSFTGGENAFNYAITISPGNSWVNSYNCGGDVHSIRYERPTISATFESGSGGGGHLTFTPIYETNSPVVKTDSPFEESDEMRNFMKNMKPENN